MNSDCARGPTAITIAIPAHNEEAYLGPCLDAVIAEVARDRRQRALPADSTAADAPVEILVIDNASSDKTAAVASARTASAAAAGASLRVIGEPLKGLTRARQRGQREATGAIVGWVDADTRMPPGWIRRVRGHFDADPAVVCVSGPYRYLDQPRNQRWLVQLYWWALGRPMYRLTGYMAVGGNFAVRREAVDRIGGFDESIAFYGEDTDIARRLSEVGKVVFDWKLEMPTSARRFAAEGIWRTAYRYAANYLSEVILKRPAIDRYRDIR